MMFFIRTTPPQKKNQKKQPIQLAEHYDSQSVNTTQAPNTYRQNRQEPEWGNPSL